MNKEEVSAAMETAGPSPETGAKEDRQKKKRKHHVSKEVVALFRKRLTLLRKQVQEPLFFCSAVLDQTITAEQFAQTYVLYKMEQSKQLRHEKNKRKKKRQKQVRSGSTKEYT
jgi:hypothetical protein